MVLLPSQVDSLLGEGKGEEVNGKISPKISGISADDGCAQSSKKMLIGFRLLRLWLAKSNSPDVLDEQNDAMIRKAK